MAELRSETELRRVLGTFLFRDVDEMLTEHIIEDQRCVRAAFARGAVVFDETHFRRALGIVLHGALRVEKRGADGRKMGMSRLGPGDLFGAAAVFHEQPRYATILTAEQAAEILFLPESLVRWAMKRDFRICENYVRYLSSRILFLNEKISSLTAGSAVQRVALFLLAQQEAGIVRLPMTELSRQLHLGRASLYRALDAMIEAGVLEKDGKQLRILDAAGMHRLTLPTLDNDQKGER